MPSVFISFYSYIENGVLHYQQPSQKAGSRVLEYQQQLFTKAPEVAD
jgi:hypothetical protein